MDIKFIQTSTKKLTSSELPARAAHLSTFRPSGCGQVRQKNGRIDLFSAFLGQPRFSGCPAGSQKSPIKIKKLKNGGRKVPEQRPDVLAYEKNPIWASIWEDFGTVLGLYFSVV